MTAPPFFDEPPPFELDPPFFDDALFELEEPFELDPPRELEPPFELVLPFFDEEVEAFFDDDELDAFFEDDELLFDEEEDFFDEPPPLELAPPFFDEADFFDDEELPFLLAAMLFLHCKRFRWGAVLLTRDPELLHAHSVRELHETQFRRTCRDCHVQHASRDGPCRCRSHSFSSPKRSASTSSFSIAASHASLVIVHGSNQPSS